MGWFCPLTGCSLEMLRKGVYTILSVSIATFICGLPPKSSPCWSQIDCCFWPLLQKRSQFSSLRNLSLQAGVTPGSAAGALHFWIHPSWVTSYAGQHLPFNADLPATSGTSAPFSCPVLTANHLLWPHVLLLLRVCLPFPLVFVVSASSAPVYA